MTERMKKKRDKPGRPPVDGETRDRNLKLRLTADEILELKALAARTGFGTVTGYIRSRILPGGGTGGAADMYRTGNDR